MKDKFDVRLKVIELFNGPAVKVTSKAKGRDIDIQRNSLSLTAGRPISWPLFKLFRWKWHHFLLRSIVAFGLSKSFIENYTQRHLHTVHICSYEMWLCTAWCVANCIHCNLIWFIMEMQIHIISQIFFYFYVSASARSRLWPKRPKGIWPKKSCSRRRCDAMVTLRYNT